MTDKNYLDTRINIGRLRKIITFLESPLGNDILKIFKEQNTLKDLMNLSGEQREIFMLLHKLKYMIK